MKNQDCKIEEAREEENSSGIVECGGRAGQGIPAWSEVEGVGIILLAPGGLVGGYWDKNEGGHGYGEKDAVFGGLDFMGG